METRIFNTHAQLRSASKNDGEMKIAGYAARYNLPSKPIADRSGSHFVETLASGAFRNVVSAPDLDCVALINHDANRVLGRTVSRTLRLSDDNLGLYFECDLSPKISFHRDLFEAVSRGDMNGCSFAFLADEDEWSEGSAYPVRTIRSVKALRDVSVVTNPAYEHTQVGASRSEVDLAEIRSRIERTQNWRQERLWRESCEFYGLDPNTASTYALGRAHQRSVAPASRAVVDRRRALINELLS